MNEHGMIYKKQRLAQYAMIPKVSINNNNQACKTKTRIKHKN